MAGTTSPDNIPYMTTLDGVIDAAYTESLANGIQSALTAFIPNVADLTALAALSAATEGRRAHVDELNVDFQAVDGVWVQQGTSRFATTADRTTAYAKAAAAYLVAGARSRITTRPYDQAYSTSPAAWVPAEAVSRVPVTATGAGVTVAADGLVTFTAATTFSLNGLSDFRKVRVEISVTSASADNQLSMRLRTAGGADNSSTSYDWAETISTTSGNPSNTITSAGQTSWTGMPPATGRTYSTVFEIEDLGVSRMTRVPFFEHTLFSDSGVPRTATGSLSHRSATTYDGLTFTTDVGNVTGTIRVLGYI